MSRSLRWRGCAAFVWQQAHPTLRFRLHICCHIGTGVAEQTASLLEAISTKARPVPHHKPKTSALDYAYHKARSDQIRQIRSDQGAIHPFFLAAGGGTAFLGGSKGEKTVFRGDLHSPSTVGSILFRLQ